MSSRLTEDVTTELEIVSLTSVTGVVTIKKDVNKDANISGKFGRKDSPDAACRLMIIRFWVGLFIHSIFQAMHLYVYVPMPGGHGGLRASRALSG